MFFMFKVDLSMKDDDGGDLSSFITNGEWELIGLFNVLK